jgi:putative Holliday junction resolvase
VPVIFALDVGEKRVGIAKSDPSAVFALPYGFIERENSFSELKEIFKKENADKIVVGMPFLPSGGLGSQSKDVEKFIDDLKQLVNLPVLTENEVLTSIEAENRLKISEKSYSKGDVDTMAAVIILESYLRRETNA